MQSAKHAKHANGEGLARRERGQKARTTPSRFCSLFSRPLACLADLTPAFGLKAQGKIQGAELQPIRRAIFDL